VDESCISKPQKKLRKIIAYKRKHQIESIYNGESGVIIAAVCCASAAGQHVLPITLGGFALKNNLKTVHALAQLLLLIRTPSTSVKNVCCVASTLYRNSLSDKHEGSFSSRISKSPKNAKKLRFTREHKAIMLALLEHIRHKLQILDIQSVLKRASQL
jgi:hypothetical protein